ncbi:type IV pilus assembly protein PilM [Endozoicomonas sp. G2_2]|uniref:type IV pilus assembly protein PilM n=1 Tax=Endozoicomonas sp. G2_2 TaxID=2821092 RepID=UPI001AD9E81D|nr:type IV pilus assembly protein PilM [Endozoicomonas sp. G2_2]MBO9469699.1 type IV pilus assembly protein PilM [Endozoicomonas sp. G2_2]
MGLFEQFFKSRTRPFLGVDISSTRIKLLELDGKPGAYRVLSYASEALPAEAVADDQVINPEAVAATMSRALERAGTRTRDAAIAVSGPTVISKIIDMPADLSDEDMEQQIGFDAEQYIPHAIEEVNLDFQALERDPNNPDVNRVLLVACRRENIETRVGALEMAGVTVRTVDVEEYALQNASTLLVEQTPALAGDVSVAVFDIGAHQTRLSVQHSGRHVYSRELSFGGHALASRLIDRHDLKDADQLRARLRTGELDGAAIAGDVTDFAERLAGQIDRALQFYISAASRDEEVNQVVLVGGATLYPGLEAAISRHLSRPVSIGNPLAGMLASSRARRNHVDQEAPALMVAAGLALRSIR